MIILKLAKVLDQENLLFGLQGVQRFSVLENCLTMFMKKGYS